MFGTNLEYYIDGKDHFGFFYIFGFSIKRTILQIIDSKFDIVF
jgi:hypothetical protein